MSTLRISALALLALAAVCPLARADRSGRPLPPGRLTRIAVEPLPDPAIPGFRFPEAEATVTGWITAGADEKISAHAWGLWTALTSETGQRFEGQTLRVFETWLTPEDLTANRDAPDAAALQELPRQRAPLARLHQLRGVSAPSSADRVAGYVKYDPVAANHLIRQGLLHLATLQTLLDGGAQQITPFPANALVVKPIFQIASAAQLAQGRYYPLKVWEGPPPMPRAYGPDQWPHAVWVDLGVERVVPNALDVPAGLPSALGITRSTFLSSAQGNGAVDLAPASDGSSRTDDTTYPLNDFIWFQLSAADAAGLNLDKPGTNASAGDFALLVGMHVAGRETVRWTWQTFWWTPAPDSPPLPSSALIAAARPDQLTGAPRHYAMATAYATETPVQPVVGGRNVGPALYAYNPWVEAAFAPSDLPDSLPGLSATGLPVMNNVGVQSNCMSCHARATFNPAQLSSAPQFAGARYTDLSDPAFTGTLQVDFLWSVPRNAQ